MSNMMTLAVFVGGIVGIPFLVTAMGNRKKGSNWLVSVGILVLILWGMTAQ